MLAKEMFTDAVVTLRTSDTAKYALKLMEDQKLSHLPIVNNIEFLGLISENDIFAENKLKESIGNHTLSLSNTCVEQHQHVFDVVSLAAEFSLTIVPVVDNHNNYLGSITLPHLLECFSKHCSLLNPGSIIILERNIIDYSLEEIAHIVESNDAKILNCYVSSHIDSTKLEVTLKINKLNIYPILQTFERYNYIITGSFVEDEYMDDIKDRFDSLMSYLNV